MLRADIRLFIALTVLPLSVAEPHAVSAATTTTTAPYGARDRAPTLAFTEAEVTISTPWDWPVAPPHPIIRPYLAPETPYSAGHRGIDIDSGSSSDVRAPSDGIVHFAGTVVDRPVLSIRHPGGFITSYEPVTTTLARGDVVVRGEVVGQLQAGHCARPCLHLGVRLDGEYVSPLIYLGGIPRAILLPTREL
ncbi:M23 family metallopeptidase [Salinibacterium sp. M195]|uniref:M23 family metallopeptidase n=1 Tax=Salinibacterium sp. M195 TaxID=2583374 RepID=UPI001C633B6F|nr:M23 family metallopeptidase [Salinibacterium sp. M195]QYH35767.1 M23 family metallopeptidase [Salinibacterium sp. M195]